MKNGRFEAGRPHLPKHENNSRQKKNIHQQIIESICCGSILSLAQILFFFVLGYCNVWQKFQTKENNI